MELVLATGSAAWWAGLEANCFASRGNLSEEPCEPAGIV
jgi:hypothetical protein